jgi:glutamate synthase domain-containing protein 3
VPRRGAGDGAASAPGESAGGDATLSVPEIRDYEQINKELARLLDEGVTHVVLAGVEGQRLLAAGLRGGWSATIVVDGHAGPELAAGVDAPALTIHCRGRADDGAGRGLAAGLVLIDGDAGDGLGYTQRGGTIVVRGDAGHRPGLMQSGGSLVVLGTLGRLAGERQSGGLLVARRGRLGPHAGRGRLGGRVILLEPGQDLPTADPAALEAALRSLA